MLLRTEPSILSTRLRWLLFDALEPVLLAFDLLPLAWLPVELPRASDALCLLIGSLRTLLPSGSRGALEMLPDALLARGEGRVESI